MNARSLVVIASLFALFALSGTASAAVSDGACAAPNASAVADIGAAVNAAESTPGAVATTFYDAFLRGDAATMNGLYAPNVHFRDTAFEYSDRAGTMKMWRFTFANKGNGVFNYKLLGVHGNVATVHWVADYKVFGRPVHNEIDTQLTIVNGKIVDHRDLWDWNTWSRQALPLGRISEVPALKWAITRALRATVYFSDN